DFQGRFHKLDGVGINPLPIQRPIPLWMGGWSDRVVRRAARLADGIVLPRDIPLTLQYVKEAGRDPAQFGRTSGVSAGPDPHKAAELARAQEAKGVTHLGVGTQGAGYTTVDQHIEALRKFKAAYG